MAVVSAITGIASASAARQPSSAAPQSWAPPGLVAPDAGIGLPASPDSDSTNVRPGCRRIRAGEPAVADVVGVVAAASASAVSAAGASGNGAAGDAAPRG